MNLKKEVEIVRHTNMKYLEIFLVEMTARQPHGHDDLEIGILLEGTLSLSIESETYLLKQGDIYIINRYQVHSFLDPSGRNLILAFQIHSDFYRKLNYKLHYLHFDSNLIRSGHLHQNLTKRLLSCAAAYFAAEPFYELKCTSLLSDALYLLLHDGSYSVATEREYQIVQNATLRINRITEYIAEHYQEPVSLETIAEMEHITTYHVSHFMKKMLGISFQEYLNSIRFDHALRLLSQTDLTIMDVCMESGFSSSRYLNRMFQKNLGCTVKEYKKGNHKQSPGSQTLPVTNIQKRHSREGSALLFGKRYPLPFHAKNS